MTRRLAAWACIFAWLLLVVGPLDHSVGHKDDHIHVGGAVVPISGAASHSHDDGSPAAAIAEARRAWNDEDLPPGEAPTETPAPAHGFDSLAHFTAVPLPLPPVLPALREPISPSHAAFIAANTRADLGEVLTVPIRGPPSRS